MPMKRYIRAVGRKVESASKTAHLGFRTGRSIGEDRRAQSGMSLKPMVMVPVGISVGALVAGIIIPIGIDELATANTSNYSSGADTLWTNLDLFVVLAVLGMFVGMMMSTF